MVDPVALDPSSDVSHPPTPQIAGEKASEFVQANPWSAESVTARILVGPPGYRWISESIGVALTRALNFAGTIDVSEFGIRIEFASRRTPSPLAWLPIFLWLLMLFDSNRIWSLLSSVATSIGVRVALYLSLTVAITVVVAIWSFQRSAKTPPDVSIPWPEFVDFRYAPRSTRALLRFRTAADSPGTRALAILCDRIDEIAVISEAVSMIQKHIRLLETAAETGSV